MPSKHLLVLCLLLLTTAMAVAQKKPLRVGIVGLTHAHVHGILSRKGHDDIQLVGIVEPNQELAQRYAKQYGYPMSIVYKTTDEMLAATKPEVVTAFGSIYEHLAVVQACAPKGIHVMVEKPLAVSLDHARKMEALAKKHRIHLLTNYETTWYPTNHEAYDLLKKGTVGPLSQVVIHDGHRGPKNIGVNKEFLDWLTDPVQNGGGALIDFGCYGVNLMTWLQEGKRPTSVTAVTQQFQPENNPKVDDESTILLTYDKAKATIQGSWNWPIGRKDMEIYGQTGAIYADNKYDLRVRHAEGYDQYKEEKSHLPDRKAPYDDPFTFLVGVVRNEITLKPYDLSSLENNVLVVEILEAARESAKTHKSVRLEKHK